MRRTNTLRLAGYVVLALTAFALHGCYVGRFFVYNFADVNDYKKFPEREISKGEGEPFAFVYADTTQWAGRTPKTLRDADGAETPFPQYLEDNNTTSFLILHRDTVYYEQYFYGRDETSPMTSFSVAKSFVSTLVGIAIAEGKITSIEDPITKYLPEMKDPRAQQITVRHALDMCTGIKFNENSYVNPFAAIAKFYYGKNLKKQVYGMSLEEAPGEDFEYQSVNTQILALVVERATGKPVDEYLEEKIWTKLGMESSATWNLDNKKSATPKAFCCLNARTRDYARFGRLFLHKGDWQGEQLVPEAWVERSASADTSDLNMGYKNQWWHVRQYYGLDNEQGITEGPRTKRIDYKGKPYLMHCPGSYYAEGILGQFIYVNPEKDLVIVRTGKKVGEANWPQLFEQIAALY